MKPALIAFVIALSSIAFQATADISVKVHKFSDLKSWEKDDHASALEVFKETCTDLKAEDWQSICAAAFDFKNARLFFETFFLPVLISDGADSKFTGYYEPELPGSLVRTSRFKYPIYALPEEAKSGQPWKTRREIEQDGVLEGRGLELAWLDDPVDLTFLQIQGSGRIKLTNGNYLRVGYGGKNGHNYKSLGGELVRQGIYEPHQVSAAVIKNWVKRNPVDGQKLLWSNPSYVFFHAVEDVKPSQGPLGAMNRSITAGRSIAIDPNYVPLGAPVWIEKQGRSPMRRLMIAQDTGSAIKGAQRADIFMGSGAKAGRLAGQMKDRGSLFVLLPVKRAMSLMTEPLE